MQRNLKYGLFAATLVMIGMLAGFRLKQGKPETARAEISSGFQKIQEAIWFVERNYVDEPDSREMVDDAIRGMLEGLDPHSFYIPAKEMEVMVQLAPQPKEKKVKGKLRTIKQKVNVFCNHVLIIAVF